MADEIKMPESVLAGPEGTRLKTWGPPEELAAVGKSIPKKGALEKVTGRAQYSFDVHLPRMLYGAILGSSQAHARIGDMDIRAAMALPGVKTVLTPADEPRLRWDAERFLLDTTARFAGQEIAAVAAEDETTAEEAVRLIKVRYDRLPVVIDPEDALKPGTVLLQPQGNLWKGQPEIYQRGNIEAGLAAADFTHEASYTTSVQHHATMEPHGCVAAWSGDELTLWDSTQGIHWVRDFMALRLRMPINKIRVISQYTGGGYGSKNGIKPFHIIAALLARKSGRPVKLFMSRADEFVASHHRPQTIQYLKAGVKNDGTLTALYSRIVGQAGPYQENAMWAGRAGDATRRLYHCPHVKTETYTVHTNSQSPIPCRGPGTAENLCALEQFMDELAEKAGMDPLAFRMKNYSQADQQKGLPYSSKGLAASYQKGAEAFRWEHPKPGSLRQGEKFRGVGMGSLLWAGNETEQSQAMVVLQADGTAQVVAGISNIGVGAETIFTQIAAEELGYPVEAVGVSYGDTHSHPYTINSSYGSRTTPISGPAVRNAAADAKRKLLALAASSLEAGPADLDIKEGKIFLRNNPAKAVPVREVTKRMGRELIIGTGRRPANPEGFKVDIFGAHFVEVEVDGGTGSVKLLRAVCVHDSGRWINPLTAESQIQGGFIQGAGMALTEERVMDKRLGIQLNRNLHEYGLPTVLDVPESVVAVDPRVRDVSNNINAKGLAEPPTVGAGGAIGNAIYNAIGVRIRDYPITPDKILAALEGQRR